MYAHIEQSAAILHHPQSSPDQLAEANQFLVNLLDSRDISLWYSLEACLVHIDANVQFIALRLAYNYVLNHAIRLDYADELTQRIERVLWSVIGQSSGKRMVLAKAAQVLATFGLRVFDNNSSSNARHLRRIVLKGVQMNRVDVVAVLEVLVEIAIELEVCEFIYAKKLEFYAQLKEVSDTVLEYLNRIVVGGEGLDTREQVKEAVLRVLSSWSKSPFSFASIGQIYQFNLLGFLRNSLFESTKYCILASQVIIDCINQSTVLISEQPNVQDIENEARFIVMSTIADIAVHFRNRARNADDDFCAALASFCSELFSLDPDLFLQNPSNSSFFDLMHEITANKSLAVSEFGLDFWINMQEFDIDTSVRVVNCQRNIQIMWSKVVLPDDLCNFEDVDELEAFLRFRHLSSEQFLHLFLVLKSDFLNFISSKISQSESSFEVYWRTIEVSTFILSSLLVNTSQDLSNLKSLCENDILWNLLQQNVKELARCYLSSVANVNLSERKFHRKSFCVFASSFSGFLVQEVSLLSECLLTLIKRECITEDSADAFASLLTSTSTNIFADQDSIVNLTSAVLDALPTDPLMAHKLVYSICNFSERRGHDSKLIPMILEYFIGSLKRQYSLGDICASSIWKRDIKCFSSCLHSSNILELAFRCVDWTLIKVICESPRLDIDGSEFILEFFITILRSFTNVHIDLLNEFSPLVVQTTNFLLDRFNNCYKCLECFIALITTQSHLCGQISREILDVSFHVASQTLSIASIAHDPELSSSTFLLLETILRAHPGPLFQVEQLCNLIQSLSSVLLKLNDRNSMRKLLGLFSAMNEREDTKFDKLPDTCLKLLFDSMFYGIISAFPSESISPASRCFFQICRSIQTRNHFPSWLIHSFQTIPELSELADSTKSLISNAFMRTISETSTSRKFSSLICDISQVMRHLNTLDVLFAY
jgi:hypothetical protein